MSQSLIAATISGKLIKGILGLWLKDKSVLNLGTSFGVEFFESRAKDYLEARRTQRFFEDLADRVVNNLSRFIETEHKNLPKGDIIQITEASVAIISAPTFFDLCIEERLSYDRIMKSCSSLLNHQEKSRSLNRRALDSIFGFILLEFIAALSALPQFNRTAFRKILEDTELIIEKIERIQAKIDELGSSDDDATQRQEFDYRRHFARRFRHIQLFGIDSKSLQKKYDLSISYVNLSLTSYDDRERNGEIAPDNALDNPDIADSRMILLSGAPGSGKTTLLSWLAVNCADRSLEGHLAPVNAFTPMFFSIREYANLKLPKGRDLLLSQLGVSEILDEKWARRQMKAGNLLFLLDGFDEVNEDRRKEVPVWIGDLFQSFPDAKFFVTSRIYAAATLYNMLEEVTEFHVEPMDVAKINKFVDHWYKAYANDAEDMLQMERLRAAHERLKESLLVSAALRAISSNPLLCALICYVNADRDGFVPTARGELYNIASDALLERREKERKIDNGPGSTLSKQQKFKVVSYISDYFFARRAAQLPIADVTKYIAEFLPALGLDPDAAPRIVKYLVERSQVLRSPGDGSIDFFHKTFQEYFYARRAVDANLREMVADEFYNNDKREVVAFVFAVGPPELIEWVASKVIDKLGKANTTEFCDRVIFFYSCITEAAEVSVSLRSRAYSALDSVLPPKTKDEAKGLGSAGRSIIEPISRYASKRYRKYWPLCVEALAATLDEEAFPVLAIYARLGDENVDAILLDNKGYFESNQYNTTVLANCKHIKHLTVWNHYDFDLLRILEKLESIEFDDCGERLGELPVKATVKKLTMRAGVRLSGTWFLTSFPNLERLMLDASASNVTDFSGIGRCAKLQHLELISDQVVDLNFLTGLDQLSLVDVSECLSLNDVTAVDRLSRIKTANLPFAAHYDQINSRLNRPIEILDEDADDYLNR